VIREARDLPGAAAYATAALGYVLARGGAEAEARILLDELTARAKEGYVSAVAFAMLHLGLSEHERALDWIERAREERRGWMAYLTVNPLLDPLRTEPRFREIVARMGLS